MRLLVRILQAVLLLPKVVFAYCVSVCLLLSTVQSILV